MNLSIVSLLDKRKNYKKMTPSCDTLSGAYRVRGHIASGGLNPREPCLSDRSTVEQSENARDRPTARTSTASATTPRDGSLCSG